MKRAFTLVELLVVISIVSMLASIVMVRISLAQASSRDAVRTQQVHQIDLATKLYVEKYGKAPLALTGCDIQSSAPTQSPSSCFAVSTAAVGSAQGIAWTQFKSDLSEFIKVPEDPCTGTCTSSSEGFSIGYTYVAPLAMQYYCATGGNCTATSESYQIYAPMERQTVPSGSSGSSANYAIAPTQPPATLPTISSFIYSLGFPVTLYNVFFNVTNATTCVMNDEGGNLNNTTFSTSVAAPVPKTVPLMPAAQGPFHLYLGTGSINRNGAGLNNPKTNNHVSLTCSNAGGSTPVQTITIP